jgi:hypothetical protein
VKEDKTQAVINMLVHGHRVILHFSPPDLIGAQHTKELIRLAEIVAARIIR